MGAALTNSICQFPTLANFKRLPNPEWADAHSQLIRASSSPPLTPFSPDSATNLGGTSKGETTDRRAPLPIPALPRGGTAVLAKSFPLSVSSLGYERGVKNATTSQADYLESAKSLS